MLVDHKARQPTPIKLGVITIIISKYITLLILAITLNLSNIAKADVTSSSSVPDYSDRQRLIVNSSREKRAFFMIGNQLKYDLEFRKGLFSAEYLYYKSQSYGKEWKPIKPVNQNRFIDVPFEEAMRQEQIFVSDRVNSVDGFDYLTQLAQLIPVGSILVKKGLIYLNNARDKESFEADFADYYATLELIWDNRNDPTSGKYIREALEPHLPNKKRMEDARFSTEYETEKLHLNLLDQLAEQKDISKQLAHKQQHVDRTLAEIANKYKEDRDRRAYRRAIREVTGTINSLALFADLTGNSDLAMQFDYASRAYSRIAEIDLDPEEFGTMAAFNVYFAILVEGIKLMNQEASPEARGYQNVMKQIFIFRREMNIRFDQLEGKLDDTVSQIEEIILDATVTLENNQKEIFGKIQQLEKSIVDYIDISSAQLDQIQSAQFNHVLNNIYNVKHYYLSVDEFEKNNIKGKLSIYKTYLEGPLAKAPLVMELNNPGDIEKRIFNREIQGYLTRRFIENYELCGIVEAKGSLEYCDRKSQDAKHHLGRLMPFLYHQAHEVEIKEANRKYKDTGYDESVLEKEIARIDAAYNLFDISNIFVWETMAREYLSIYSYSNSETNLSIDTPALTERFIEMGEKMAAQSDKFRRRLDSILKAVNSAYFESMFKLHQQIRDELKKQTEKYYAAGIDLTTADASIDRGFNSPYTQPGVGRSMKHCERGSHYSQAIKDGFDPYQQFMIPTKFDLYVLTEKVLLLDKLKKIDISVCYFLEDYEGEMYPGSDRFNDTGLTIYYYDTVTMKIYGVAVLRKHNPFYTKGAISVIKNSLSPRLYSYDHFEFFSSSYQAVGYRLLNEYKFKVEDSKKTVGGKFVPWTLGTIAQIERVVGQPSVSYLNDETFLLYKSISPYVGRYTGRDSKKLGDWILNGFRAKSDKLEALFARIETTKERKYFDDDHLQNAVREERDHLKLSIASVANSKSSELNDTLVEMSYWRALGLMYLALAYPDNMDFYENYLGLQDRSLSWDTAANVFSELLNDDRIGSSFQHLKKVESDSGYAISTDILSLYSVDGLTRYDRYLLLSGLCEQGAKCKRFNANEISYTDKDIKGLLNQLKFVLHNQGSNLHENLQAN